MTRLALFSLSILALALPAAAQAAPKKLDKSPDAIRAYWTAERMENAKPKPAAKPGTGGGGGGTKPGAIFTTFQPPSLTVDPVRTNGKVFFTEGGSNWVCSGTSVGGANESVVWTAGHCVNEGPGAYVTNFAFVPAYRDNVRPYGTWAGVAIDTTDAWRTAGEFGKDVGAVAVEKKNGVSLADTVGARPMAFNQTRDQRYTAHGYPAEKKFNGQRLYVSDTRWIRNDTSANPDTMAIATDLNGGSSGGGWIAGDYTSTTAPLVSVNSYGYSGINNTMFGPYLQSLPGDADDASDLLQRAGAVTIP